MFWYFCLLRVRCLICRRPLSRCKQCRIKIYNDIQKSDCHYLIHWGRVTHICVSKLATIGTDNGLSPGRHQAIIWTNVGLLSIGPLGTNFSEILIKIQKFSFMKVLLKIPSAKWWPLCPGGDELNTPIAYLPRFSVAILWSVISTWALFSPS